MKDKYRQRLAEYRWFAERMRAAGHAMNYKRGNIFAEVPIPADPEGVSAEEAYHRYESTGERVPCREAEELVWLERGKQARDWHITEWAAGIREGSLFGFELIEDGVPMSLIRSVCKAVYAGEKRQCVSAS